MMFWYVFHLCFDYIAKKGQQENNEHIARLDDSGQN